MISVLGALKIGKASGGFVKSQHVLFSSPKLGIHLTVATKNLIIGEGCKFYCL